MWHPAARGRSSASTWVISPFSKISRTRAGPPGLIADFDRSCIDFAPRQLRVVQKGVRRPCEFCEVAHQFALARLRSLRTRQVGQRTKKASFQKTLAIHVAIRRRADERGADCIRASRAKPG